MYLTPLLALYINSLSKYHYPQLAKLRKPLQIVIPNELNKLNNCCRIGYCYKDAFYAIGKRELFLSSIKLYFIQRNGQY